MSIELHPWLAGRLEDRATETEPPLAAETAAGECECGRESARTATAAVGEFISPSAGCTGVELLLLSSYRVTHSNGKK